MSRRVEVTETVADIPASDYGATVNGYNCTKQTKLDITDVRDVYPYCYHNFIIKDDGSVWSCGRNEYGALEQGNFQENYDDFVKLDKCIYYEK